MQRFNRVACLAALLCAFTAHAQMDTVVKGATSYSATIRIIDAADGTPETTVAYNTSGIDLEYCRQGAACVDITEVTQTAGGAWTSGGFVHKGHGYYRLDLPNAALAAGADWVDVIGTVPDMIVIGGRIRLTSINLDDAVRGGMTALPTPAPGAAGGLLIAGTNADFDVTGNVSIAGGVTITQSTTNQPAFSVTGNGTGAGFQATGGATGPGFFGVGGSTSGLGFASSITAPSGTYLEGGLVRSGTLSGTHSATTADLGTNAPTRDISCMILYLPDHDLSRAITSYNTSTGVATFATTSVTLANGNDWFLYGTPCGASGYPTAADIWGYSSRTLTAGTNIVLAKGTGITGFNDLSATNVENAVWNATVASHVTAGTAGLRLSRIPDAAAGGNGGLPTVNASNQVAGVSGNVVGSVGSVSGNVSGSVGSVAGNVAGNVVGSVGSLGTTAQTHVQTAATAALNAWTIDGELATDVLCRMAATMYGASEYDSGDDETVFSNPMGTEVRLTIAYGSDNGDRGPVTLGASCGN